MPACCRVPLERPFLPVVWPLRMFELRGGPLALAGDADVDPRDRSCARPGLSTHDMGACVEDRSGRRAGDSCTHTHEVDRLVRSIGPLVDVMARLELTGVGL